MFNYNILANTEEESNTGKQLQSMEPVFDTKAALWQLPMIP